MGGTLTRITMLCVCVCVCVRVVESDQAQQPSTATMDR